MPAHPCLTAGTFPAAAAAALSTAPVSARRCGSAPPTCSLRMQSSTGEGRGEVGEGRGPAAGAAGACRPGECCGLAAGLVPGLGCAHPGEEGRQHGCSRAEQTPPGAPVLPQVRAHRGVAGVPGWGVAGQRAPGPAGQQRRRVGRHPAAAGCGGSDAGFCRARCGCVRRAADDAQASSHLAAAWSRDALCGRCLAACMLVGPGTDRACAPWPRCSRARHGRGGTLAHPRSGAGYGAGPGCAHSAAQGAAGRRRQGR